MRIGYATSKDPTSHWSWSGIHHAMFQALRAQGLDVVHIGGSLLPKSPFPKPLQKVANSLGLTRDNARDYKKMDELARAQLFASAIDAELENLEIDVLVSTVGSFETAFLKTQVPIVLISDSTFHLLRDYYPLPHTLTGEGIQKREEVEKRAIARADLLSYPSHWAAQSAISDYGANPEKTKVINFGANLAAPPSLETLLRVRSYETCRLLFIGKNWERKGGQIAYDAMRALNRLGIETELTVCGATPPDGYACPQLISMGMLNKNDPLQRKRLEALFLRSHFLLVPSRAECYGIVFCEANAFALPALAAQTGGVPSIITDGQNGYMLPLEADGAAFGHLIAEIFRDRERYLQLATGARNAYDARLNWMAWGRSLRGHIEALLANRQTGRACA